MWSFVATMSLETSATFLVYVHPSDGGHTVRLAELIKPQDMVLDTVRKGVFSHRRDSYSSESPSEKKRWMWSAVQGDASSLKAEM